MCINFFISTVQLNNKVTKMCIKHAEYSCKVRHILVLTDKPTCLFLGLLLGAPFPFLLLTFPFSGVPTVIVVDWWKVGETKHEISWLFLVLYSKFGVKYDKIKKVTNPSLPLFQGAQKRILDIASTLGLSNTVMRLIDKRATQVFYS